MTDAPSSERSPAGAKPSALVDARDRDTLRPTLTRMARIAKALFNVAAADVLIYEDGQKVWRASDATGAISESDPASALVVQGEDVMWIGELLDDERFKNHPMVTDGLKLRFYAGVPIKIESGEIVGALAVYDTEPKPYDARLVSRLQDMAGVVANDFDRVLAMRDRARMVDQLRRSEERFQIAIEGAGLHVYELDYRTKTLFKAGAEDSFFLTPRTYEDLQDNERIWQTVHPDDRDPAIESWNEALAKGQRWEREYRLIRGDGTDVWARATAALLPDERGRVVRLVGSLQNVTDRKLGEMEAHAAKAQAEADAARLAFALDTANSAAWELDLSGPTLIGADDLGAICGRTITVEDVINMTDAIVFREDRHLLLAFVDTLREGGHHSVEHRISHIDGTIGWVRTSARVFEADGISRIIFLTTDITERKRAEHDFSIAMRQAAVSLRGKRSLLDAIARDIGLSKTQTAFDEDKALDATQNDGSTNFADLYERLAALLAEIEARDGALVDAVGALRDARTAAEAANIAKSQFLAMMSHELRTPLNAVIGYAEILEEDLEHEGKTQSAGDAKRIHRAARNLLELINEVLDFSKIEAGRMEIKLARANVPALINNVADMTRHMAEAHNNSMQVMLDPELGDLVVDEARVRQCLLNLVSNACKFTEGGVVTIHAGIKQEKLCIDVMDTGCGITPAEGAKLFQPFVQADSSLTRKKDGTGLGLVITRKLANLMGGDVTFTSIPNVGSTFTMSVAAYPEVADADAGEGAVVVVIDDDPDARDLVRRALTGMPFRVRAARTTAEGARIVQDERPALVFLDIHLPDGSGWDLLAAFKADATLQDVPVIVLTIDEDRERALTMGAEEHVLKPLDRDRLAALTAVYARVEPHLSLDDAAA